jgi:hypothetical protein
MSQSERKFPVSTHRRVRRNTVELINRRIDAQIERNIRFYSERPAEIGRRLAELDREWDVERAIEANAASVLLAGLALSFTRDRRFLVLPVLVGTFLLQHALEGWCPPVPILRRLGFRTADEINRERYALKMLRGDFASLEASADPARRAEEVIRGSA